MKPALLKSLAVLGLAGCLAIVVGCCVATGSYVLLELFLGLAATLVLVLMPGYGAILAFGLLNPITLPVPFISGFPFLLIILGLCILKYLLEGAFTDKWKRGAPKSLSRMYCLFFLLVAIRYMINPELPHLSGFGESITGFRSYLRYGLCFGLVYYLGRLIPTRMALLQLIRWIGWVSSGLIFILICLAFTRSMLVAGILTSLRMPVDVFDNGLLRFVMLPGFGCLLLTLLLLPEIFPVRRSGWWCLLVLSALAIVVGGNRAGLGMCIAIITTIPLLRGQRRRLAITVSLTVLCLIGGYFAGEMLSEQQHVGAFRILALVSPRMEQASGAEDSVNWREIRWRRAWEEIQAHPLIGKGYGGVENAWVFAYSSDYEEASIDIDLASGGIHNGYIGAAYALGIPAALLFIFILVSSIITMGRRAVEMRGKDPLAAQIYCFVCASLISEALSIYIGSDANDTVAWFVLGMGVLMDSIRRQETRVKPSPAPVPRELVAQGAPA